jgi:16S rRNA processing protein RimM
LVEIGQIVGSFGLRGQLKIAPSTDFLNRFETGQRLFINDQWIVIEKMTVHKNRPLIKLEGVTSIDAAEKLKWAKIFVEGRPELDPDEYLVEDLVGLRLQTDDGAPLGTIDEILPNPAHDLIISGELMIPLIKEFVKSIDLESKLVTVHLIPGMLSD